LRKIIWAGMAEMRRLDKGGARGFSALVSVRRINGRLQHMWPFGKWWERAKLRAVFGKYISKDIIDRLERGDSSIPAPVPARLHFVLLQVRDEAIDPTLDRLSRATEILVECGGMIDTSLCSCVFAIFGHPISVGADEDRAQRDASVSQLVTALGRDMRLIYGDVDGVVGNIGSSQRFKYGALMTDFQHHLTALLALEFGQTAKI
jgi:hypothetical protein